MSNSFMAFEGRFPNINQRHNKRKGLYTDEEDVSEVEQRGHLMNELLSIHFPLLLIILSMARHSLP